MQQNTSMPNKVGKGREHFNYFITCTAKKNYFTESVASRQKKQASMYLLVGLASRTWCQMTR